MVATRMHLSFVRTSAPIGVDSRATLRSLARLFPQSPAVATAAPQGGIVEIRGRDSEAVTFVAPMPVPIPNREADQAARFGLCAYAEGFQLGPHAWHFMVTTQVSGGPVTSLARHTQRVAAVADAHGAVAIYEGNAGATHPAAFYVDAASSAELPLMLWTGVSVASEGPGRMGLLTMGMGQLALPNLLLTASQGSLGGAFSFAFDLLAYVVRRGAPIAEGETVGRTAREKLAVRYVDSPMWPGQRVARVDLP